jgi:hypothetical protein
VLDHAGRRIRKQSESRFSVRPAAPPTKSTPLFGLEIARYSSRMSLSSNALDARSSAFLPGDVVTVTQLYLSDGVLRLR